MAGKYGAFVLRGDVMNPNYIHTITLYNCLRAADNPKAKKDIWYRFILHDCFYKNVMGRTEYLSKEPRMDNTYTVRIPESDRYKPYHEWIQLSEEERKHFFTVNIKDIVIKGECFDEITSEAPNTASQLLSRRKPDSFAVTAFSDNTSHIYDRHYRLGG